MTEAIHTPKQRSVWSKWVIPMAGGGLVGFLAAYFGMDLVEAGLLGELDGSAMIALGIALIYVVTALAVGVGAISPGFGSTFLNVEDADELREMKQTLIASGIGMFTLGLALAALALGSPGGLVDPSDALIVAALLFIAGAITGFWSHQHSDELMREVGRETGTLSYYLCVSIIGGWAALAHVSVVSAPAMLDILSIFWVVALVAAFWVCGRRGMLNRR